MSEHSEAVVAAHDRARRAERDLRDAGLRGDAEQAERISEALEHRGDAGPGAAGQSGTG